MLSCEPYKSPVEVTRAIYHWKTSYFPDTNSISTLQQLNCTTIYLRLFDVSWDEATGSAVPYGQTTFPTVPTPETELIPVVFITNKVFLNLSKPGTDSLAIKVKMQVDEIMKDFKRDFTEIQMDCDWTESSRDNYFQFLETLKTLYSKTWMTVSATIRLHQIKYPGKTGVPPVDRGMLMFYNMGKIQSGSSPNSIFNKKDALKYVPAIENYSLPLDVALPLFTWTVQSRDGKVIALLKGEIRSDSSFLVNGNYIMQGDELKIEKSDHALCLQAAELLIKYLNEEPRRVVIFDLDSNTINTSHEKDLEKIYRTFNPTYAKAPVGS